MWRSARMGGGLFLMVAVTWVLWDPLLSKWDVRDLRSDSVEWRAARASLLQRGRGSLFALRDSLSSADAARRLRSAQVLGLLGEDRADEVLLEALRGPSEADARMAMDLLRELWNIRNGPPEDERLEIPARQGNAQTRNERYDLTLTRYYAWVGGYVARAERYLAQNEPRLAVRDALSALLLEPEHFDALVVLSRSYAKLGFPELSLDCLQQAVRINPCLKRALSTEMERLQEAARKERERRLRSRYMDLPLS